MREVVNKIGPLLLCLLLVLCACAGDEDGGVDASLDASFGDGSPIDAIPQDASAQDGELVVDAESDASSADDSGDAAELDANDAGSRDAWTPPTGPLDPTFQISDLTPDDCLAVSSTVSVGENLGFVASSARILHYDGYQRMGAYDFEQLRGQSRPITSQWHLVSDLATGRVYTFLYDPNPALGVRRLVELDPLTGDTTNNQVVLSTNIPIETQGVGVYSGLGRAVIQDATSGGRLYDVEFATGNVTDLGPAPLIDTSAPWATYPIIWGIREYFDGSIHLVRATPPLSIIRYRVSDQTVTTLRRFTWLSSMYAFTVVPRLGRWYFRNGNGRSQFRTTDTNDTIGYCGARFSAPAVLEMTGTTPAGGSATVTMPSVDGLAEPGATVQIFTDSTCAGPPIGLGTADPNGTFAIPVPAATQSATTFFANAVRPNGNVTFCFPGPTYFHDTMAPAFAGATQAIGVGTSISVLWNQAFDDQTDVRYEICASTTQGDCLSSFTPALHEKGPGELGGTLTGLAPNTTYYLAARAVDEAGNASGGSIERSATTGAQGQNSLRILHFDTSECPMIEYETQGPAIDFAFVGQRIVLTDASQTISYRGSDLSDLSVHPRGLYYLLADLSADRLYTLTYDGNVVNYFSEVNTLEELDPTTGVVLGSMPLVDSIGMPFSFFPGPDVFDGLGRAIAPLGNVAVDIDLATAVVTDLPPSPPFPVASIEIAESFGGETYVLFAPDLFEISRFRIGDGAIFPVATRPPYVWGAVTISLNERRMYWVGRAFPPSNIEAVGWCPMSFDRP